MSAALYVLKQFFRQRGYRAVILVDFEYSAPGGNRPKVVCMVAHDLLSDRKWRMFQRELHARKDAPFTTGSDSLVVAYYASAEINCFRSLGWRLPANVLDLYPEFRNHTNDSRPRDKRPHAGLVDALAFFGESPMAKDEKDEMRKLAMTGGPFTTAQEKDLLDYCESDVVALKTLLPHLINPGADLRYALLRGEYMRALGQVEYNGIPIDTVTLRSLTENWDQLKVMLVKEVDPNGVVYNGTSFRRAQFGQVLYQTGIPWPRSVEGRYKLDADTFKEMAVLYPSLQPLAQLRSDLSGLKAADLRIGDDGRNRTLLSAFRSRTGRNQPSTSRFIFGLSAWARSLILPQPGYAVVYVDWSQQEFAIAAFLSGDGNMLKAYESSDPYLAFAKMAGAVPKHATKEQYPRERDTFKQCTLGVGYGMRERSLAVRIGQSPAHARQLLGKHHLVYPDYWRWSDNVQNYAINFRMLRTVFDWRLRIGPNSRSTSLRNWPVQSTGAEMLRLAVCLAVDAGVKVVAPVHDALLVEAPIAELDDAIFKTRAAMDKASEIVLDGLVLSTDVEVVKSPDRYMDKRGAAMWHRILELQRRLAA